MIIHVTKDKKGDPIPHPYFMKVRIESQQRNRTWLGVVVATVTEYRWVEEHMFDGLHFLDYGKPEDFLIFGSEFLYNIEFQKGSKYWIDNQTSKWFKSELKCVQSARRHWDKIAKYQVTQPHKINTLGYVGDENIV